MIIAIYPSVMLVHTQSISSNQSPHANPPRNKQRFNYISKQLTGQFPPGQLPPWTIAPRTITPRTIAPGQLPPDNCPRTIAPGQLPPGQLPPGQLPPGQFLPPDNSSPPPDNCPLGHLPPPPGQLPPPPPGQLPPRTIAPRDNCPPRTIAPRDNCPLDNVIHQAHKTFQQHKVEVYLREKLSMHCGMTHSNIINSCLIQTSLFYRR